MPRKPKREKQTITVVVNGAPVTVILHSPTAARKSWYAYWPGLVASRSTGQSGLEEAIVVAEAMVRDGGKRPTPSDGLLTDEEFEAIQRAHFGRHHDPKARERAEKSLTVCLEAMRAFKKISECKQVALASADDCAAFQRRALAMPKNWRQQYPRGTSPEKAARISPNTVLKWSRALHAAFERANRNAGKKCVRGVVSAEKLLAANPWNQFDWIRGRPRPLRQFDAAEINSLLDFFETKWTAVTVAALLTKFFLWSSCRQQEATGLRWSTLRRVGSEVHFEIVGKWGIERWVRIPCGLFRALDAHRTASDFVFAGYNEQLRRHHQRLERLDNARRVGGKYRPQCLGDWFADRLEDWSAAVGTRHAYTHVFRKTSLQYVRSGEDINRQVAEDARVSKSVLMTSYVRETDEQLRQASNRTFSRIIASLPSDLAQRCGHDEKRDNTEERLRAAIEAKDWQLAADLTSRLAKTQSSTQPPASSKLG